MARRIGLAILAIGSGFLSFSEGGQIGFSVESVNGVTHVSAGSSIRALAATLIVIVAFVVALDPEDVGIPGPVASTTRRAVAWFLDFFLSLSALSALMALLPLAGEALATGHFQWQFERDTATAMDWILSLVGIALLFVGMAWYWGFPVLRGGQTIGQGVLGLRVVNATSEPLTLRTCLVRGVLQPFAPLLWLAHLFSPKKTYFHDELAHVQVVTTRPVSRGRTRA